MHGLSRYRIMATLLFGLLLGLTTQTLASTERAPATADHTKFDALKGPFNSAPEVTAACLTCHTEAGEQVRATTHWTWLYNHPETGQQLGKSKVINSFCGMVVTNEARCTSCHVGYGWEDMSQPPPIAENAVDCLVCHDTTGEYWKFPTLAGFPTDTPREWPKGSGTLVLPPDLAKVARNVGASDRENCGSCHFYGGGADGVKHGDLDSSLVNPSHELDVHMASDGLNFSCSDCHTSWGHNVAGSRYQVNAKDTLGIDIPGHTDLGRASCESCHGSEPKLPHSGLRPRWCRHQNVVGLVHRRQTGFDPFTGAHQPGEGQPGRWQIPYLAIQGDAWQTALRHRLRNPVSHPRVR